MSLRPCPQHQLVMLGLQVPAGVWFGSTSVPARGRRRSSAAGFSWVLYA